MRSGIAIGGVFLLLALGVWIGLRQPDAEWSGVDEAVVQRFAEQAGRPAQESLVNTDQGDLLLFVFLVAGAAGGFVAGYCFRGLFGPDKRDSGLESHRV